MATFPRTIVIDCLNCGNPIPQPDDPGRRKEYCSGRCRTAAYRRRNRTHWEQQKRAEEEAWANQRAQQEYERERSYERRHGEPPPPPETMPGWCTSGPLGETEEQKRQRRKCYLLMMVALHAKTPAHEAANAREKAEKKRRLYKL